MKIPIDRAPAAIEHFLDMAERYRITYEYWAQKADEESDPILKASAEEVASSHMDVVNSCRSDAEHLIQQLAAAGRPYR